MPAHKLNAIHSSWGSCLHMDMSTQWASKHPYAWSFQNDQHLMDPSHCSLSFNQQSESNLFDPKSCAAMHELVDLFQPGAWCLVLAPWFPWCISARIPFAEPSSIFVQPQCCKWFVQCLQSRNPWSPQPNVASRLFHGFNCVSFKAR